MITHHLFSFSNVDHQDCFWLLSHLFCLWSLQSSFSLNWLLILSESFVSSIHSPLDCLQFSLKHPLLSQLFLIPFHCYWYTFPWDVRKKRRKRIWLSQLLKKKTRTSCDAWLLQRRQPVISVKKTESSERKTGNKGSINLRKGLIYRIYRPFSNDLSPDIWFWQSSLSLPFFFFFVSGGRDVCP